ncbi:hypothetical protein PTKIN_Ptkin05aG0027100 [Pterospermum kingtungense]
MGVVKENRVVLYVDEESGNIIGDGKVTRKGILCSCCCGQFTVGGFENHFGGSTGKPYQHIVLAAETTKQTLFDCLINALGVMEEKEKVALFNKRLLGAVADDANDDACIICADGGNLICCDRCPSTYHPHCIFMENIPQGAWLCSYCIHEELRNMVGVRNKLHGGLSWSLHQWTQQPLIGSPLDDVYNKVLRNSKIAVAWLVMNECFSSSIDRHTRVNIPQNIVYINRGSNLTPRINYSGFYTAVLEKNEEIISVASIRRIGMAHVLENCLESALYALQVEKMVIPSVERLADMWTDERYSFSPIEEDSKKELCQYNTVMFPGGITKLEKNLACTLPDLNMGPSKNQHLGF